MKARDTQRSRVYEWENLAVRLYAKQLCRTYTDAEATALLATIWQEQAARFAKQLRKPPRLRYRQGGASSYYSPRKHEIAMLHSELWVLLHEAAHALGHRAGKGASHGPRFVAIYLMLLTVYGHVDNAQMRESASSRGVKVLDRFHVEAAPAATLFHFLPDTLIGLAVSTGKSYRQVQGALIGHLHRGDVRRRGTVYHAALRS